MFYFEQYLRCRGISKQFGFCKKYKKIKGVLIEINRGCYAVFGTVIVIGGLFILFQKYSNYYNNDDKNNKNNENNFENSNITDLLLAIDEGVIRFKKGKKITISFGTSTESNEPIESNKTNKTNKRNETESGLLILAICLVLLYASHVEINRPPKNDKNTDTDNNTNINTDTVICSVMGFRKRNKSVFN